MYYHNSQKNVSISQNFVDKILEDFIPFYQQNNSYDTDLTHAQFIEQLVQRFSQPGFKVTWNMGGTWADYNGKMGSVSPDTEPEMNELDNFLIKHYPNMGIMHYRMIANAIEKTTEREGDFYGGSTTNGIKFLSYEKLNNLLVEHNYEQYSSILNHNTLTKYLEEKYNIDWFCENFSKSYQVCKIKDPDFLNPDERDYHSIWNNEPILENPISSSKKKSTKKKK